MTPKLNHRTDPRQKDISLCGTPAKDSAKGYGPLCPDCVRISRVIADVGALSR